MYTIKKSTPTMKRKQPAATSEDPLPLPFPPWAWGDQGEGDPSGQARAPDVIVLDISRASWRYLLIVEVIKYSWIDGCVTYFVTYYFRFLYGMPSFNFYH